MTPVYHTSRLRVPAGLLIVAAVLAVNFVGDALLDALDPKNDKS